MQLNMPHQYKERTITVYCNKGDSQKNYLEGNSLRKTEEEESTYCMIPLMESSTNADETIVTESRLIVA